MTVPVKSFLIASPSTLIISLYSSLLSGVILLIVISVTVAISTLNVILSVFVFPACSVTFDVKVTFSSFCVGAS